jgi:hypothetical protein
MRITWGVIKGFMPQQAITLNALQLACAIILQGTCGEKSDSCAGITRNKEHVVHCKVFTGHAHAQITDDMDIPSPQKLEKWVTHQDIAIYVNHEIFSQSFWKDREQ